jgi:hypothetical protein
MPTTLTRDLHARMAARAAWHRRLADEYARYGADAMTEATRTLVADHEALAAQWLHLCRLLVPVPDQR